MHMLRNLLLISIPLTICSCSFLGGEESKEPEVVEITADVSVDTPESELLATAKQFYETGLYTNAREVFEKIRDGYPFGPYAEYSEVKIADCYFYAFDYGTAGSIYEDFIKQHPASRNLPYVMLQSARSYHYQYGGTGKDPEPLHKAIKLYEDFLKKYGNTIYTTAATKYLKQSQEQMIEHEKAIMAFYERAGQNESANYRKSELEAMQQEYQEKDERFASISNKLPPAVAVPKLVDPKRAVSTMMAQYSPDTKQVENELSNVDAKHKILRIACQSDSDRVFFFLSNQYDENARSSIESSLSKNQEGLAIKLPETKAEASTMNCLGTKDLTVTQSGQIKLESSKSANLFYLQNPARLLVALSE